MDIRELDISTKTANALWRNGISTVEELRQMPPELLIKIRWLGVKGLGEIQKALYGDAKRSLYQCFNAKVLNERIYCKAGHPFPPTQSSIRALTRGEPLGLTCCQECPDYDEMGPPIPKGERGWV